MQKALIAWVRTQAAVASDATTREAWGYVRLALHDARSREQAEAFLRLMAKSWPFQVVAIQLATQQAAQATLARMATMDAREEQAA